jgi:hypothetical protein
MEYTNPALPEEAKMALTEIEKQFISMRSSGLPIRKIAKTLNKSTRTICLWNKKFYRNIVEINSEEFKELRNKIVRFKNTRLDFLIDEFKNIKDAMANNTTLRRKNYYNYESHLDLMMKISKLIEKFESDLLISSDSLQKIDESQIIDASSEDIETVPENTNTAPEQKKCENVNVVLEENTENTQSNSEENTENTFSETQKSDENEGNTEDNTNENIENNVVPKQNDTKNDTAEHTDNM